MDVHVNVINQKLRLATNIKSFVSGSQNFIRFYFELSEEWDNLSPFVQFCQDDIAYNVYLDDENSVYLPPEITEGKCTMALYGNYGEVRATTECVSFEIEKNQLVEDGESTDISQSLYDQLVKKVKDMYTYNVSYDEMDNMIVFESRTKKGNVPFSYDDNTCIVEFLNEE